jgi:hypothetical protein
MGYIVYNSRNAMVQQFILKKTGQAQRKDGK